MTSELDLVGRYRLGQRLGGGAFGVVHLVTDVRTGEELAVKLESAHTKYPQVAAEARLFRHLAGCIGVPSVRWSGVYSGYNAMISTLLGPSLQECFKQCHNVFSLKTVLQIGKQVLGRLEYIHSKGVIHRDVKPDNLLMGRGDLRSVVHVVDLGLGKRFRDCRSRHIPYKDGKSLTGTARYTSIATHLGAEQSRRDDLEALAYMLLYFLRGQLPWQGIRGSDKQERYDRILDLKLSFSPEDLGVGFPLEFATFLRYTRSLEFEEDPDYSFMRALLADVAVREGYRNDSIFDWSPATSVPQHPCYPSTGCIRRQEPRASDVHKPQPLHAHGKLRSPGRTFAHPMGNSPMMVEVCQ